jgi:micrococcal nuclease
MKRFITVLLLAFAVLAGCSSSSSEAGDLLKPIFERYPELKNLKYTSAVVKRVVDGDTFELDTGEKVRMIGMNTPETVKPNSPVEAYGKEASEFTKRNLTGKKVLLFADAGDKDKYGRLLRYVFIEGETQMFNETLLLEGYANIATVPPNVLFADRFLEAERSARANQKGLWAGSAKAAASAALSCSDPKIKGNINSKNEKIYHMPGSAAYEQTKAEQLFCTEKEAQAAGFRKAAK